MARAQKRADAPSTEPQINMEAEPETAKYPEKVAVTVVFRGETHFKLKVLAASEGKDVSQLVEKLVYPCVRGIRVTIPKAIPSPARFGVESEDPTAAEDVRLKL